MNKTKHDTATTSAVGVRLEGIDLSFGKTHVLKGIDLQIEPGEFFAFLGPSGCGKTTLLRLIAGFESAQAGRVIIGDQEVSHLPPWRRNLGREFLGGVVRYQVAVGGHFILVDAPHQRGETAISEGTPMTFCLNSDQIIGLTQ